MVGDLGVKDNASEWHELSWRLDAYRVPLPAYGLRCGDGRQLEHPPCPMLGDPVVDALVPRFHTLRGDALEVVVHVGGLGCRAPFEGDGCLHSQTGGAFGIMFIILQDLEDVGRDAQGAVLGRERVVVGSPVEALLDVLDDDLELLFNRLVVLRWAR